MPGVSEQEQSPPIQEAPPRTGDATDFQPWIILLLVAGSLALRNRVGWFEDDELRLWSTLFVSVCIQALPFLVLGVVISGLIATFVSPELVHRVLPRRQALAVPTAGLAGMALPGCECGSVPIAGSQQRAVGRAGERRDTGERAAQEEPIGSPG